MTDETRVNGRPNVRVALELVTPGKAAKWLKLNTHNRSVQPRRVARLEGAIKRGEFLPTAQGIGFHEDGSLSDGQHRLHAIVSADHPVWLIVVRGLPHAAQDVVDQGKARTLGDILTLRGEKDANYLAGAVRAVYSLQKWGELDHKSLPTVTPQQFIELLDDNPGIRDVLVPVRRARQASGLSIPPKTWASLHYEFSRRDRELAERFLNDLSTGVGLGEDDPALHLRRTLLKQAGLPTDRRLGSRLQGHLMVKAWNAYVSGSSVRQLKADRRESFPEILAPAVEVAS